MMLLLSTSSSPGAPRKGLVLYHQSLEEYAVGLTNLLGHFEEYSFMMVSLDRCSERLFQDIRNAEAVFLLGEMKLGSPEKALQKVLLERTKCTCFVGNHEWLDILPVPKEATYALYKGGKYWVDGHLFYPFEKTSLSRVYASLEADGTTFPFIFQTLRKNCFYVLGFPFFGKGGLILADSLHEILGVSHEAKRLAMIRLEDLNPSYEGERLEKLRECIDYLHGEGIPFAMAVYPVFKLERNRKALRILENEPFMETLRKAEKYGGTVIHHGTSHQYRQASGEGSEFWDMKYDRPVPGEKEYFHEHMRYGLWLFRKAGLHPKLFEAPHYNFPLSLQKELPRYFDTLAGSLMLNNKSYKLTQDIPYFLYRSAAGLRVLPEQLGYIEYDDRVLSHLNIEKKLEVLDAIVRDPLACFFYHPYVEGARYLQELVPFLLQRGYSFVDASAYAGGLRYDPEPVEDLWPLVRGRRDGKIGFGIVTVAGLVVLLFILIYGTRRVKRRKEMFR
ncbi:MAG: hypothetical protein CSA35_06590 [Dethiosulfovibrio peptidovorans]|nr:MAG: hypothetical protein CSA35_06590 [Dethiosulfovibrio peptidovorans]